MTHAELVLQAMTHRRMYNCGKSNFRLHIMSEGYPYRTAGYYGRYIGCEICNGNEWLIRAYLDGTTHVKYGELIYYKTRHQILDAIRKIANKVGEYVTRNEESEYEERIAVFKTKKRATIFGNVSSDETFSEYLAIRGGVQ